MTKQNNSTTNILLTVLIIVMLGVLGALGYMIYKGQSLGANDMKTPTHKKEQSKKQGKNDNTKDPSEEKVVNNSVTIELIGDKRSQEVEGFIAQIQPGLKQFESLKNAEFVVKDFTDEGVKQYIKENEIEALPAIIFSTKDFDNSQDRQNIKVDMTELKDGRFILNTGSKYDPFLEVCDNGKDDNEDGKVDCEDPKCAKELACAPKVDKPKAELYIMSYCPYGLQAQKGFLEAMLKLDEVADMEIKFVDYLMHGEKEGEENIAQYCIQKDQKDKYKPYLQCFLKEGKIDDCKKEAQVNEAKLTACVAETKKSINYDANMADKSRNYPLFALQTEDNKKYGVSGSPSFVLNGKKVERAGRSGKAFADLICSTFKEKPAVCNEEISSTTYDAMFGFTTNGNSVAGACGG